MSGLLAHLGNDSSSVSAAGRQLADLGASIFHVFGGVIFRLSPVLEMRFAFLAALRSI